MKLLSFVAEISPESKGVVGTVAALSLSDWSSVASIAAGIATAVYMLRKTVLLRAPVRADFCENCDHPEARCVCEK